MTTGQGTQSGTKREAQRATEDDVGDGALQRLRYLGGGLAAVGATLGLAGALTATPVAWAFGLGAAAVSLVVLAVTSYNGRSQSV